MNEDSLAFLKRLLAAPSPSGYEERATAIIAEYLPRNIEATYDRLGTLSALLRGEDSRHKVMLMAHADEVGLTVRYIDENGFVWFSHIGGVDYRGLPGKKVTIHGRNGDVPGVVGLKPVHLCTPEERRTLPPPEELFIDIGAASREEAAAAVAVGDPASFDSSVTHLLGGRIASRGLDDKSGCFVLAEVLTRLAQSGEKPPYDILGIFTAQEEIGLRGATVAAHSAEASIGICIEADICSDYPGIDRRKYGEMGVARGPILPRSPAVDRTLFRYLSSVAEREGITVQVTDLVHPDETEVSEMQISREGVATALVMIPLRYMHSTAEVVSLADMENAIGLLTAALAGMRSAPQIEALVNASTRPAR
ncbi:MAG TPA: M20/M25/M40 family metallo-hydrolase [Verrucomicrobiae bacterium]|nr:M20/M25/M40 family metallo-hydrolase [Verrucomicrobiae bacterium]